MNLLQDLRIRLSAAKNAHEWRAQVVKMQAQHESLRNFTPGILDDNIVWVFGGGRTGSSWMAEMLSEAFDLTLWFEPRIGSLFDPNWIASHHGRSYVFSPKHEHQWLPAIREFILRIGTSRFPDARGFVIKETDGSIAAPLFLKAFPGSKPVLLVRDPRDVAASWNDAYSDGGWRDRQMSKVSGGNPLKRLGADEHTRKRAEHYVSALAPALDAFERYEKQKSLVTYEELRANGPEVMERIAADLGLPGDKARQTAERHAFEAIPEDQRGAGKFRRKAQPGSWREDLTEEQVAIVEEIAGPLMDRLGYERSN